MIRQIATYPSVVGSIGAGVVLLAAQASRDLPWPWWAAWGR